MARNTGVSSLDFETVYRTHAAYVQTLALRLVGDLDGPDVAQVAWLKAGRALPTFAGRAHVRSWLHRIVVNAANDHHRRRTRRPLAHAVALEDVADGLVSDDPTPLDRCLRAADAASLDAAIRALAPGYQGAVLAWLEDMSVDDAAAALGVPPGTYKSRTARGLDLVTRRVRAQHYGAH